VIHSLIYVVVVILVVGLLWYLIDAIPLQEPLNRFAKIAITVVAFLAIILMLLQVADAPIATRP
jgi:hypothetical protein